MAKLHRLVWALILCSTLFVSCAFSQSTLTQILDTVYNPDGSLFSGTVVITFNGFASPGTVAPQSTSAQIYTGALSVLLVPSTTASPGAYYAAVYNSSNGTVTWTETWSVPPSPTPLTLSQVRTSTTEGGSGGSGGSGGGPGTISVPIPISDVTDLSADLAQVNSSLAGLTATTSALTGTVGTNTTSISTLSSAVTGLNSNVTAFGNTVTGLTNTVTGISNTVTTLGNTVSSLSSQVNSLTAGTSNAQFADGETPSGTMDGNNAAFTLAQSPAPPASLQLYRNGLEQMTGIDFTLSGNTITFLNGNVPKPGDVVQAFYRVAGTGQSSTFSDATLAAAPNPVLSLKLYKNGMLLDQNGDYTLSGATITFSSAQATPQSGDLLVAYYRH